MRVTIESELPPAPAKRTLVFPIQPPRVPGTIQIAAPAPMKMQSQTAAVQLVLRQGGVPSSLLQASALGKDDPATLVVTPTLVGLATMLAATVCKFAS